MKSSENNLLQTVDNISLMLEGIISDMGDPTLCYPTQLIPPSGKDV